MPRILAHRLRDEIDWVLFSLCIVISLIGVINLYSTGQASGYPDLYLTQIYFLVFGGCAAFSVALVDYRHYERFGYVLYGIGLFLLILVLFVGTEINNAKRWIVFGDMIRFQPSELTKVFLVVGLAKYLHHDPQTDGRKLTDIIGPAIMTILVMALILKEPDLGTALLCLLIFLSIMMLTRLKARSLIVLTASAPIASVIAWNWLKPYQKERVVSFLNSFIEPEADRLGAGWHAYQARVAVGSGQVTGKGFLQGTSGPHHFLPAQSSDFPFAIFAEEHGFIGAAILILLYSMLIIWCVRIAANARDRFGSVIAIGVGSIFFWHVLINLGMVLGILPVVGVTLPLFSAGGSSILTCMLSIGLLMNVSIHRFRR
ncbi:MAG: rod shape-determining protein RodA [Proteobacteria bacterium]|nr:rod shape-determining protein RodA [Pseudomonadota bacterium]